VELSAIGLGAVAFITVVPERPVVVDLGLAVLAVGLVAAGARGTREQFWGSPPGDGRAGNRVRLVGWGTIATLVVFAGWAIAHGTAVARPAALATLALFLPWAWLQQALVQFYVLGRLRVLLRGAPPLAAPALTGLLYGLAHAPDWPLVVVTAGAGVAWSACYERARRLVPLAVSHAVLGTAYYAWVRDEDLVLRWLGGH
jgi:membrane protease YdiL (CAAX protease family)